MVEDLRKDAISTIAKADRIEVLLFSVSLAAIIESGWRALPDGYIENIKNEYTQADFSAALERNRLAPDEENASVRETCKKVDTFIRRYLLERGDN